MAGGLKVSLRALCAEQPIDLPFLVLIRLLVASDPVFAIYMASSVALCIVCTPNRHTHVMLLHLQLPWISLPHHNCQLSSATMVMFYQTLVASATFTNVFLPCGVNPPAAHLPALAGPGNG